MLSGSRLLDLINGSFRFICGSINGRLRFISSGIGCCFSLFRNSGDGLVGSILSLLRVLQNLGGNALTRRFDLLTQLVALVGDCGLRVCSCLLHLVGCGVIHLLTTSRSVLCESLSTGKHLLALRRRLLINLLEIALGLGTPILSLPPSFICLLGYQSASFSSRTRGVKQRDDGAYRSAKQKWHELISHNCLLFSKVDCVIIGQHPKRKA